MMPMAGELRTADVEPPLTASHIIFSRFNRNSTVLQHEERWGGARVFVDWNVSGKSFALGASGRSNRTYLEGDRQEIRSD